MALTYKNELIRILELCESGCEHCKHADARYRCEYGSAYETACSVICDAPEIDAEPVVRCIDCIHARGTITSWGLYGGLVCKCIDRDVDENFYCAYGEKKKNESDKKGFGN